jgi:hypothetical protein
MKIAIVTGLARPSQHTIRQMVTQSDGHIVQRHDQLEEQC